MAILDQIVAASGPGLQLRTDGGSDGAPDFIEFELDRRGYLTVLYLDGDGFADLINPTADRISSRIRPGEPRHLGADPRFVRLFVLATPRPIPREWLVTGASDDRVVVLLPADAAALAKRLQAIVSRLARDQFSAAQLRWDAPRAITAPQEKIVQAAEPGPTFTRGLSAPWPKVPDGDELDLLSVPDPEEAQ